MLSSLLEKHKSQPYSKKSQQYEELVQEMEDIRLYMSMTKDFNPFWVTDGAPSKQSTIFMNTINQASKPQESNQSNDSKVDENHISFQSNPFIMNDKKKVNGKSASMHSESRNLVSRNLNSASIHPNPSNQSKPASIHPNPSNQSKPASIHPKTSTERNQRPNYDYDMSIEEIIKARLELVHSFNQDIATLTKSLEESAKKLDIKRTMVSVFQ